MTTNTERAAAAGRAAERWTRLAAEHPEGSPLRRWYERSAEYARDAVRHWTRTTSEREEEV